jgi:chromosome segregation ATPase
MTNRSFDDIPEIRIEDNDRVTRPARGTPPSAPSSRSNNAVVTAALIAGLLGVAGAGYGMYAQAQANQELLSAQARIQELENRLNATGEEMGNSTVALQVKLTELTKRSDELWEQMDKLWASAWRRNQKELRDLEKVVEDNRTNLQRGQNGITSALEKNTAQLAKVDGSLQSDINNIQNDLLAVNLEIESVKQGMLSGQGNFGTINDKIAILEQRNNSLKQKMTQLERDILALRPTSP